MYRINRIFVSEIIAGGNLLRNGFVPVFRQGGQADHGVLFASNGTCKTTLLSFILSVFCPGRQRFVQHLQSGGDKALEQYLIAGRPALVMLDLVTDLKPTLFEEKPIDHLVLGQLLYRHRSMQDKTERHFFIAQSADFFEEIRSKWDELICLDQPYRAVRDFMLPHIQQTTSQKEWADKLEQIGLDPWLVDRQVDFARTEGGIKDAFKFPTEAEFLSFFLGCVTDLEAAATLRDRIGQDLRKMQERPRKLQQLKAVRGLKEQIADFDVIALKWRSKRRAIQDWQLQLGEATHLLQEAEEAAEKSRRTLDPTLEETRGLHRQAENSLETVVSNIMALKRFRLEDEIAAKKTKLQVAREEVKKVTGEELVIKAADFMADIRAKQAEAATKKELLGQAGREIIPLQRKVDGLAVQYHLCLDEERGQEEQAIASLKAHQKTIEETRLSSVQHRDDARTRQKNLDTDILRLDDRIKEAEARRGALSMEPGEEPMDARDRLLAEQGGVQERIALLREEIRTIDETVQAENSCLVELQGKHARVEADIAQARKQVETEAAERSRLCADAHIARIAGTHQVDVSSADLVSRLDESLSRTRDRFDEEQLGRLKLKQTLEELDRIHTLAADDQTRRLIAHYHEEGIEAGELKSYPEYLAGLYDKPEQIAMFIEGDPGRFTGIMAANEEIMAKVRELPVPPWLHRPVVVSSPCPPEAVRPVDHMVISPSSPEVYSKNHLEAVKAQHREELAVLNQKIEETGTQVREMEKSSRALHAYRESYPDRAAVATLSERVEVLENSRSHLVEKIGTIQTELQRLVESKTEQEKRYRQQGDEAAGLKQSLNQVEKWLEDFAKLAQWQEEVESYRIEREKLEKDICSHVKTLENLKDENYRLKGDIRERKSRLQRLDERAGEILRPLDVTLTPAEQEEALSMDLSTLRRLHEAAREDLRQLSNELGIGNLRKELEALQEKIAGRESRFQTFRRENSYDETMADDWAGRSWSQREERLRELGDNTRKLTESCIRLESEMQFLQQDFEKLTKQLSGRKAQGKHPDLTQETMAEQDSAPLLHRLQSEERKIVATRDRLAARCGELERKLKNLEAWHQEVKLCLAENRNFEAVWDETSPRYHWPELLVTSDESARMATIAQLREDLQQMAASEKKDRQTLEKAQGRMRKAFERFQADLQDESYRSQLPAVVDELRSHDADSLGSQATELIGRCEDIARNFETDLEITQRFMDSLVDMLLQHCREYYQKLQAAGREVLPEDVFIYGGKSILRTGTRLDFAKHQDAFRQSVENWLYELMQQDRLPEANPRAGNRLGAELLYQLLGAASGRKIFGIQLLKCDDTGSKYEAVGKDLGSGGEALTIAVLLYALLISMRRKRKGSSDGKIPAFLVLDNPLGVCNRSDFLDAQLKVASGVGLQCVYLTGINDRESLDLFELRVAICKGKKQLKIDGNLYDCLEVTELNVEKQHGEFFT